MVKEDENREAALRFIQKRLLMTLERAVLLECWGMETRDQAFEKGIPRKWESQRSTLGLKNL